MTTIATFNQFPNNAVLRRGHGCHTTVAGSLAKCPAPLPQYPTDADAALIHQQPHRHNVYAQKVIDDAYMTQQTLLPTPQEVQQFQQPQAQPQFQRYPHSDYSHVQRHCAPYGKQHPQQHQAQQRRVQTPPSPPAFAGPVDVAVAVPALFPNVLTTHETWDNKLAFPLTNVVPIDTLTMEQAMPNLQSLHRAMAEITKSPHAPLALRYPGSWEVRHSYHRDCTPDDIRLHLSSRVPTTAINWVFSQLQQVTLPGMTLALEVQGFHDFMLGMQPFGKGKECCEIHMQLIKENPPTRDIRVSFHSSRGATRAAVADQAMKRNGVWCKKGEQLEDLDMWTLVVKGTRREAELVRSLLHQRVHFDVQTGLTNVLGPRGEWKPRQDLHWGEPCPEDEVQVRRPVNVSPLKNHTRE